MKLRESLNNLRASWRKSGFDFPTTRTPSQPPRTHDYRKARRGWGHDLCIWKVDDDGKELRASGWGVGIKEGDYLILEGTNKKRQHHEALYRVAKIEYRLDPPDMWHATLIFYPRK